MPHRVLLLGLLASLAWGQAPPADPDLPPIRQAPGQPPQPGPPAEPGPPGQPARPGLLRQGPWDRDLRTLRLTREAVSGPSEFFLQAAGVPALTRATDRLVAVFQWFPANEPDSFDQVAMMASYDEGRSWTPPRRVVIAGLPPEYRRPYDPTIVTLPDGRLRLYFTSHTQLVRTANPISTIHSAISTDGLHFTFEPGERFRCPDGQPAYDPAVALLAGQWHLLTPAPTGAFHAVSTDGLAFEFRQMVPGDERQSWIGNLVVVNGTLRHYAGGAGGLWWTQWTDGAWSPPHDLDVRGGDPAVLPLPNGELLVLYTGEPRQRAQRPPGPGPDPGLGPPPAPGPL